MRAAASWGAEARSLSGPAVGLWLPFGVLFFNLLDGLFTLCYLQLKVAEELNPLMRLAYERSPLLFMALKLLSVQGGVGILYAYRSHAIARTSLWIGLGMYATITLYHLAFLIRVWSW